MAFSITLLSVEDSLGMFLDACRICQVHDFVNIGCVILVFCGAVFSVAFLISWVALFYWNERSLVLYRLNNGWAKFGAVFLNRCDFLELTNPEFMFMTPCTL